MAADLRAILRIAAGREHVMPTAVVLDSRTLQPTPESGGRAGYDGYKRRNGSKTRIAVDTLGHLLALRVTPADVRDRAQAGPLAKAVQVVTGKNAELAVTTLFFHTAGRNSWGGQTESGGCGVPHRRLFLGRAQPNPCARCCVNSDRSCTLEEVARAAGVNRSTVSRAFANHPRIRRRRASGCARRRSRWVTGPTPWSPR